MTDLSAAIRARRAQSNAAIAARDLDAVVALMAEDVTVSVAGGPKLNGRAASRAAFAEQFADPAFRGYVREPGRIVPGSPAVEASEMGTWTGRWDTGARRQEMRGTYLAQWTYTALGWFIQSEVFVSEG